MITRANSLGSFHLLACSTVYLSCVLTAIALVSSCRNCSSEESVPALKQISSLVPTAKVVGADGDLKISWLDSCRASSWIQFLVLQRQYKSNPKVLDHQSCMAASVSQTCRGMGPDEREMRFEYFKGFIISFGLITRVAVVLIPDCHLQHCHL